jgi:hypothetical protein
MSDLAKRHQDAEVVDAEVVGHEPPSQQWQRLVSRLVFCLILGGVGIVAVILGAILTVRIVGAVAGIPMVPSLVLVAVIIAVGGVRFIIVRSFDR